MLGTPLRPPDRRNAIRLALGAAGCCDGECVVRHAFWCQVRRSCGGSGSGLFATVSCVADTDHGGDQVCRAISTGRLNASPRLHTRPINVVVFHGSQGSSRFKVGFPLRCLQRLSRPRLATRRRGWRHDRCTRGASVPVLSYWGRRLANLLRPRQIGTELSHDVLNPAHVPL